MGNKEKKLSDYIDRLNAEKTPEEHKRSIASPELEKLADTVRLVRSLKAPALPSDDFPKKISSALAEQLSGKPWARKPKRAWYAGAAAVAAIVVLAVVMNFILPFGKSNIVYAMEQAFEGVKAYHGFLEIVETNAEGTATPQAKLEVWADQEGQYYVKEIEGPHIGLITANNGKKKWQIRPDEKQITLFPAFPDPYRFTFDLGKEVSEAKNALKTKVIGEDTVSGRKASTLEVTPHGGVPYRIWIDKETRLPLQRQSGMLNALQYKVTYTQIEFSDSVPAELVAYNLPDGFKEIDTYPEQLVNTIEEAEKAAGFTPKVPESLPEGYTVSSISVADNPKIVKMSFGTQDKTHSVVILQSTATGELKPAPAAVLGKINGSLAEIQAPIEGSLGILAGGGAYAGVTNISSIRWQQDGYEYAVAGDASLEELISFVKSLTKGIVQIPTDGEPSSMKPQTEVPVDLQAEENEQKSVDAGHSPWKLDPAFVAQVFVSLKISLEGIEGEYPIQYEDLKIIQNTGKGAVIEVSGDTTPIRKVYLKRLVRQDSTGIWTVVGYDAAGDN